MAFLGSHPALQDDDVLGKFRETLRNRLEMIFAFSDHDRGSSGFKRQ